MGTSRDATCKGESHQLIPSFDKAGRLPRLDRYVARDRSLTVFQSEPDLEVNPGYSVKDDESLHFDTEEEKYYI